MSVKGIVHEVCFTTLIVVGIIIFLPLFALLGLILQFAFVIGVPLFLVSLIFPRVREALNNDVRDANVHRFIADLKKEER
jgi:hypothetical protein